jgi:hypothetical protein
MKVIKLITAALAVAGLVLSIAGPASASSKPVVFNDVSGWTHGHVKPHAIYVGEGGSPVVYRLRWSHWSQRTASARGTLNQQIPGCTQPTYLCPTFNSPVRVYLYRVRSRAGTRYFSWMRWTWRGHHNYWRTVHGYFESEA